MRQLNVQSDQQYDIQNGPSKLDLMNSLFQGSASRGDQPTVTFHVKDMGPVEVTVQQVGREDGSGESWTFNGYVRNGTSGLMTVTGYFTTRRRIGWMKFIRNF